jgi:hypothetical protein
MSDKNLPITGGCLCGAVRYEVSEEPYWVGYCHCDMCKRALGGPFGVWINFRKQSVTYVAGLPNFYQSSLSTERGFCGSCGSPLMMRMRQGSPGARAESGPARKHYPGITRGECVALALGSLDHPERYPPVEHGCADRRIPWLLINDNLRRTDDPDFGATPADDV